MSTTPPALDNEKNTTELTIAPDGRVFVFGTSRPILEVLAALQPHDEKVQRLLEHVRKLESSSSSSSQERSGP
jgi:hypothetical protein